jgi:hypothetical protein
MDYLTFVTTELIPRLTARLGGMKTALVAAGVAANRIIVAEVDSTDLRYRITATRGNRTLVAYVELTDNLHLGGSIPGQAILTLWLEGNGTQIVHAYTAGAPQPYTEAAGIDALLVKLGQIEMAFPELITKARAFLGV